MILRSAPSSTRCSGRRSSSPRNNENRDSNNNNNAPSRQSEQNQKVERNPQQFRKNQKQMSPTSTHKQAQAIPAQGEEPRRRPRRSMCRQWRSCFAQAACTRMHAHDRRRKQEVCALFYFFIHNMTEYFIN